MGTPFEVIKLADYALLDVPTVAVVEETPQIDATPLDDEHRKHIGLLVPRGHAVWDNDHSCLRTRTDHLKAMHGELGLRGDFETLTTASSDFNSFAYPKPDGAWYVVRYGKNVKEAESWRTSPGGYTVADFNVEKKAKAEVDLNFHDLDRPTKEIWRHIQTLNNPPVLFMFGGHISRVGRDDKGQPIINSLQAVDLRYQLAEWFTFFRTSKKYNKIVCPPPMDIVANVLATPEPPLPILQGIVEAPIFGFDGTLASEPGYHPSSQTLYWPQAGFKVPRVPANPTADDVAAARLLLESDLLGDFPFVNAADKAHAIAMNVQFYARHLIAGPTPLYLYEKPEPGTGATLLVEMLAYPAIGREPASMTASAVEEEMRKKITAALRKSPTLILLDNLRDRLDCAAIASAITSSVWEDRILGASMIGRFPVRCAWIASGNNPVVSLEIMRRAVRIRLNAKVDQPWLRTEFKHKDLRGWVKDNRGELVGAALTLIQAWIVAGRPPGKQTMGMFESWAKVMGGILDVAGVPGFLEKRQEFYAEADTEGQAMRGFIAEWWDTHEGKPVGASELFILADTLMAEALGNGNPRSQLIRLGKLLAGARDRVFDVGDGKTLKVTAAGKKARLAQWALALAA